ncbi:MAG TPA: DUF222 domain-containing protein [Acidothermaceae bacterium]|nr:DUF222 domain-containing protein [Acidothermaceae bacterium]
MEDLLDIAKIAPGAELATRLAAIDPAELDDDYDVLEVMAAWDRLKSWVDAGQLVAVAEFARRPLSIGLTPEVARAKRGPLGSVRRSNPDDEIAARLSISSGSAGFRLGLALELTELAATAAALRNGQIDAQKAHSIADGCRHLDPGAAAEVEAIVLARAGDQTNAQVKKAVRKAAITADPVAAQQRHVAAKDERGVWLTPLDDGVAELRAVMPAADALTVYNVLTAAALSAKLAGGETRTSAQLRADFLLAPFAEAIATGELAGVVPTTLVFGSRGCGEANLTVPASVIMGVSNAPGELTGYGAITAEVSQVLTEDRLLRRIVTNPVDGSFLAADTATYRPGAVLRRHIQLRDGTCRFKTCERPAVACELDHSDKHPVGRTCDTNMGPFCKRHHIFKHTLDGALAHVKQPNPGTFVWTMPTGHVYTTTPPAIGPPIKDEKLAAPTIDWNEPPPF